MGSDVRSHARGQGGNEASGADASVDADTTLEELAQGGNERLQGSRIGVACAQVKRVAHGRALGGGHAQILQPPAVQPNALRMLLHIVQPRILHSIVFPVGS